ncbi:MAG: YbgC/FadM family acyl-CoA thioesterase [Alphaproteobacteria bacterium]|nr:YbgC/FadM family acyl-CoA thioesterase [Alphaproteobacteria bacterium]MBF0393124.1 YbgC/FadM family acyl-CoA thioesterase [Alphaproteobacteria bacterium]
MPESGHLEGTAHLHRQRVYFDDTDAGGVVYHASYLRFAERARTEMMRLLGLDHPRMMAERGVVLAVRRAAIDYLRPARLDDVLVVRSEVTAVGGASIELRQEVRLDRDGGAVLARLDVKLACMALGGGAARLPEDIRGLLVNFFTGDRN